LQCEKRNLRFERSLRLALAKSSLARYIKASLQAKLTLENKTFMNIAYF
jgi:hypothetical protein